MDHKYRKGDKVTIVDRPTFISERRDWVGKTVTLKGKDWGCSDYWGTPAWSVEESYYAFRETEMVMADEHKSPVRTETITRTVIEPGVYGRVFIRESEHLFDGEKQAAVQFVLRDAEPDDDFHAGFLLTPTELRELARIATELADGLDAQ